MGLNLSGATYTAICNPSPEVGNVAPVHLFPKITRNGGANMKKEHEENPKQSDFVAAFLAHMDTSIAGVEKSLTENLEKSRDASVADIQDAIRDALRQV